MTTIDYYFSPSSPWTYFGHRRLEAIAGRHGATIRPMPVDLGGTIFPASGGLPLPKRSPQRQAYRRVELARWSEVLGLPIQVQPKHFPAAARHAALAIILADQRHGTAAAMRLAHAVMHGLWAEERDIDDPVTLTALADATGLPGDALVAEREQALPAFEAYTRQALDAGVFGAPWYVVDGEPFWGQDRLDLLERALQKASATS